MLLRLLLLASVTRSDNIPVEELSSALSLSVSSLVYKKCDYKVI